MASGPYQFLEADSWNCMAQSGNGTNNCPGFVAQPCGDPSNPWQQIFFNNNTGVFSGGAGGYLKGDACTTQDPTTFGDDNIRLVSTINPALTNLAALQYGPFTIQDTNHGNLTLDRRSDNSYGWVNPNNNLSQVFIDRALQSVCSNIVGGINPAQCTQDAICKAMLPRGDISRTPQCAQWAMNNKNPETDGLVQAYCNATSNKSDPLCGCYNAPAAFTALQEQLAKQGVGLTLTCNSAACRNGNAYIPSQAASIPCPNLQVCIQDVSVGSANTANLSNVNLSCKQESKITSEITNKNSTTNNTTTPAPTPAGSSLTSGTGSESTKQSSSSGTDNTQKYVEIGILVFGALIFLTIVIFFLKNLNN